MVIKKEDYDSKWQSHPTFYAYLVWVVWAKYIWLNRMQPQKYAHMKLLSSPCVTQQDLKQ